MSNISREYINKDGQDYEINIYYEIGGVNYFTGKEKQRGYYASVMPVNFTTHTDSDGLSYQMKTTTAYSGACELLLAVKRKSNKSENLAISIFNDSKKEELIKYVINKNDLK